MRLPFRHVLAFVLAAAFLPAFANEQLWSLLKGDGLVVLMRHTITTPGVGDPPGMKVDDCSTQRNLTDEGRRHAKLIGEAWRAHGAQVSKVMSSPMCRCLETAQLAFGRVDEFPPVTNSRTESEMPRQVREMRTVASEKHRGPSVVLVSHGTTITMVTGISLEPGEMLIVNPQGDGKFEIKGRLAVAGS
jgi:broad specificity phosphatase PhoE